MWANGQIDYVDQHGYGRLICIDCLSGRPALPRYWDARRRFMRQSSNQLSNQFAKQALRQPQDYSPIVLQQCTYADPIIGGYIFGRNRFYDSVHRRDHPVLAIGHPNGRHCDDTMCSPTDAPNFRLISYASHIN